MPKNSLLKGFSFSMGGDADTDLLLLELSRLWTLSPPFRLMGDIISILIGALKNAKKNAMSILPGFISKCVMTRRWYSRVWRTNWLELVIELGHVGQYWQSVRRVTWPTCATCHVANIQQWRDSKSLFGSLECKLAVSGIIRLF